MTSCSMVSALFKVIDDWNYALDQGNEICAIFFDICKAFDTVPHLPLLHGQVELHSQVDQELSALQILVCNCKRMQFMHTTSCFRGPSRVSARTAFVHMLY